MRFVSWRARSARYPLEVVEDILSELSLTQICVLLHNDPSGLFLSIVIVKVEGHGNPMDNYAVGGIEEVELQGQLRNPFFIVAALILVVPHQSDIAITELCNSADTQGRGLRIVGRVGWETSTSENVIDLVLNIS